MHQLLKSKTPALLMAAVDGKMWWRRLCERMAALEFAEGGMSSASK